MAHPQHAQLMGAAAVLEGPQCDKPVDLVHLARMTMGDRSLEKEVLRLFRSQAGLCLSRMEKAEDDTAFIEAAHAIKGSARGIGAWKVAELASELQEEGSGARGTGKVALLAEALDETDGYISHLLAE